ETVVDTYGRDQKTFT
ncbi:hypothetical protein D018_0722B, partial [Vibrio parahaemolyticus VP2007-007]